MTAAARPRRTAPRRTVRRRRDAARPGRIYLILTKPVDSTGMPIPGALPEVGYIGQTRQQVWERAGQHRLCQPFSDLIVDVILLDQGVWTDSQLDAREELWIRAGVSIGGRPAQLPRYNHDHNLENPDRIEIFRAHEHRRRREPGWVPTKPRIPRQRGSRPGRRPSRPARRPAPVWLHRWWRRNRARVVGWTLLWATVVGGVWWLGSGYWVGWEEPRNAVVLGSLGWLLVWWPNRKRRRRRR